MIKEKKKRLLVEVKKEKREKLKEPESWKLTLKELQRTAIDLLAQREDIINNPSHYTRGKIEVYDFIHDQRLPYGLSAVIKYVCRCRYKGKTVEDLKKARWFLDRAIEEAEGGDL